MTEIIAAAIAFLTGLPANMQGREFFSVAVSAERLVWIRDIRKLCATPRNAQEQYDADNPPLERYAVFLKAMNGKKAVIARRKP